MDNALVVYGSCQSSVCMSLAMCIHTHCPEVALIMPEQRVYAHG